MAGAFSHFPSSGKIWNEALCEDRELAHAQFRPHHTYKGSIQWYHMTQNNFSMKYPHKFSLFSINFTFWQYLKLNVPFNYFPTLNENVHVFEAFVSGQNMFKERATFKNVNVIIIAHKYVDTAVFISFSFLRFSGLSLVLNKEGLWLKRLTFTLSELKGEWQVKSVLIHTSCRSESSNISLVVLDKDSKFPV